MQRYIAFLSGSSVGTTASAMENVRRLFKQLGFSRVETYLQTGNVIFETAPVGIIPPLEAQITRYLQKSLTGEVEVFIRTPEELQEIVDYDAYPSEETSGALFVVLLHEPVSDRLQRELRFVRTAVDDFRANGREIYWLRRSGQSGTAPPPSIGETLGMPATVRAYGALKRLAAKYAESPTASVRSRR
jgi:uncharacterized protein (DUF1697 family)